MKLVIEAPGKWILCGEHAVLRGCPALVFPLKTRTLRAEIEEQPGHDISAEFHGPHGREMQLLFWAVVERAAELLGLRRSEMGASFRITSHLPIGGGLGASASVCALVTHWLMQTGRLKPDVKPFEFARRLENLFHGESSGVDVAVALSNKALRFTRHDGQTELKVGWEPNWALSSSQTRGITADCVKQVQALNLADPERGDQIDTKMAEAVREAEKALSGELSEPQRTDLLIRSIDRACSCFRDWGLISPALESEMAVRLKQGALAVKPTGSGGGGFVLSLWPEGLPLTDPSLMPLRS